MLSALRQQQHYATNHLTLAYGFLELVVGSDRLPTDLREMAIMALEAVERISDSVREMQGLTREATVHRGPPPSPLA